MCLSNLDEDWNSNDAAKPLDYSLKEARAFIRLLAPESIVPRPALHADGHMILFVREPEIYAELEFLGKSKIGIYARRGDHKWSEEILFDGQSLPAALSQIGFLLKSSDGVAELSSISHLKMTEEPQGSGSNVSTAFANSFRLGDLGLRAPSKTRPYIVLSLRQPT